MAANKKRSLSGIKPTGDLNIAHYLAMIRPAIELQESYDCIYFVADLHAITTNKDAALMHQYTMDIVAAFMACGLDVKKHIFFRQSDVACVAEYAWYLTCFTPISMLEQAHAYKDAQSRGTEINHGFFAYPVLMAADILMYNVDVVPVGKDQKQHVEIARDIAGSVNTQFGKEIIKRPQPLIREEVATIPGLDGRKMSKSYNNGIPLFCDEKTLKQKIMSIKTDSTALEAPKVLEGTLVAQLFKLFGTEAHYRDLETRLSKGGIGWGHAKEELFQIIDAHIKPLRERYTELRKDERGLIDVLSDGAERAYQIARPELNKLRECLGFQPV